MTYATADYKLVKAVNKYFSLSSVMNCCGGFGGGRGVALNMNCPERGREYCSATSLHIPHPKDDKGLLLLSTDGFLPPGTGTKNYQCEKRIWVYCLSRWHRLF